jgi:hypothetical protein
MTVKPPEHNAKSADVTKTGRFALLCSLPRVKGSGAPSVTTGVILALSLALLAPGVANATFTRKFERQIYRTEGPSVTTPCGEAEVFAPKSPCLNPQGLAVDSANDLWVGNLNGYALDEFEPASAGNGPLSPGGHQVGVPGDVAIESSEFGTGEVYVTDPDYGNQPGEGKPPASVAVYAADGKPLEVWSGFSYPYVAVDNSPLRCTLGECAVYVSEATAIRKFNSKGVEGSFECSTSACRGYIEDGRITGVPANAPNAECYPAEPSVGIPQGHFGGNGPAAIGRSEYRGPGAIAVDQQGDIFVQSGCENSVLEYLPSGEYVRTFNTVRLPDEAGGAPVSVAVDPVSDHLLVGVEHSTEAHGEHNSFYIDEFNLESGQFVSAIEETSEGRPPRLLHSHALHSGEIVVDSSGHVYLAEGGECYSADEEGGICVKSTMGSAETGSVGVWSPGFYFPTVELGPAGERKPESAVLAGTVNPAQHGNTGQEPDLKACDFQLIEEAKYTAELAKGEGEGFAGAENLVCELPDGSTEIKSEPEEAHPVHAEITKLKPGVSYRYRLVATSGGSLGGVEKTGARAFTAPAAPVIVSTSAANISSTFADLHAQIGPLGAATSYFFEYGPTSAYGQDVPVLTEKAPEGESIGAGGSTGGALQSVLQHVGPLAPGTTYHFRVVAVNECQAGHRCVTDGEDQAFTTLPAPVASERVYELVTPADKEGGSDMFAQPVSNGESENSVDLGTPAESGEGLLLQTHSSFGGFPFASSDEYVFNRVKNSQTGQPEWAYTSLASPLLGVQVSESVPLFDPIDLSKVALNDAVGSFSSEQGSRMTSLLGAPGGPYVELHADPPVHGDAEKAANPSTEFVGASRDLGNVVLESGYTDLCPGAEQVKHGDVLCEWSGGYETLEDGEVRPQLALVNTAPGNEAEPASECGAELGAVHGRYAHNAVSEDGARVFFTAPGSHAHEEGPGCWNEEAERVGAKPVDPPQLYTRVEQEENGEVTYASFEVSEPEAGVREEGHAPVKYPAIFAGASGDGSRVFFLTATELTRDAAELKLHDEELYEWEAEGATGPAGTCAESSADYVAASRGCLTRISSGETGKAAGGVYAVTATSADGSAVYFLANEILAANVGANGTHAAPGECRKENKSKENGGGGSCNLYRYDTETGTTTYIATVNLFAFSSGNDIGQVPSSESDWYTTPDGRYLLFRSNIAQTGYSNAGSYCVIKVGGGQNHGPCSELYRYDADASEKGEQPVVCVSCGQGGAQPTGNAEFARSATESRALGPVRAMSNNGEYAFFDTPTPLVSQATNGTLNTYEWHDGRVSLVGSGTDPAPTFFLGYSPNLAAHSEQAREGGNVFIGTHARLSPVQTNSVGNVYDARVCEPESPCIKPPEGETAQCEGGSCQTPPAAPPDPVATLLAPPSAPTLAGSPPATKVTKKATSKCRRGFVKRKVKKREACVKTKSRKRAKKSSHGKGSH